MSIEQISMDLAQTRVQSAFGTAILAKELGVGKDQGAELAEMMDTSQALSRADMELTVNPNVGANFDVSV